MIFAWSAPGQMSSPYKLYVIHHPKWSKIILISYKTFMQGQIGAYCILCELRREEKRWIYKQQCQRNKKVKTKPAEETHEDGSSSKYTHTHTQTMTTWRRRETRQNQSIFQHTHSSFVVAVCRTQLHLQSTLPLLHFLPAWNICVD